MRAVFVILLIGILMGCNTKQTSEMPTMAEEQSKTSSMTNIYKATSPIVCDGVAEEESWKKSPWMPIEQLWIGQNLSKEDFQGRFKLLWDHNLLYIFAEIVDDKLVDTHEDPLVQYWDDDCLEIFIDENHSKGNHQFNHNAFAYHISIDQQVADIGLDSTPRLYNHHLSSAMKRLEGNQYHWEVAMKLFGDDYIDGKNNTPLTLKKDQSIGFAIAYCDNDDSQEREHFIGSSIVEGEDKNRGWIDAGIFGSFILVE